jgi:hypothetical protein
LGRVPRFTHVRLKFADLRGLTQAVMAVQMTYGVFYVPGHNWWVDGVTARGDDALLRVKTIPECIHASVQSRVYLSTQYDYFLRNPVVIISRPR